MSNNQQLTTNNNNEDAITNMNSTSSDNLNLSTTNETVDEDERRRILENILNDNDDSVSDEEVGISAFMNVAQSQESPSWYCFISRIRVFSVKTRRLGCFI